jgi:thiol-disulfide isomerase/thioredoxin
MSAKYWDNRSDFFKKYFELGKDYESYIASGTEDEKAKWEAMAEHISLNSSQQKTVSSFVRELNIVVMSGIWCGDCVRQGPMLRAIEQANDKLSFRYLDNRDHPELQEELRINGAQKVPVVVALSEDFYEMQRFGDRHLSVYRRKAEQEFGAACDAGILPPSAEELEIEMGEWVDFFERIQHMLRMAPALRKRYSD